MVGGNIEARLQQSCDSEPNAIGERVQAWEDLATLIGWLDLSTGDSKYTYDAKLQESTHVFVCDYVKLVRERPKSMRLLVDGIAYDVLLIDDPMELHQHLEIHLKRIGEVS